MSTTTTSSGAAVTVVLDHPRHYQSPDEYTAQVQQATETLQVVLTSVRCVPPRPSSSPTIVGLDAEWTTREEDVAVGGTSEPPAQKRKRICSKLALLQLALPSRTTVCIRLYPEMYDSNVTNLSQHQAVLLSTLKEFLENRFILKSGVGVENDVKKLFTDWGLATHSWLDLVGIQAVVPRAVVQTFFESPRPSHWSSKPTSLPRFPKSLRDLASAWLGRELGKELNIALSDWANVELQLTPEQLEYAVADAEASRDVALAILGVAEMHLKIPGSTESEIVNQIVNSALETSPLKLQSKSSASGQMRSEGCSRRGHEPPSATELDRASSWLEVRKKAYYDNIMTYDCDGDLLFTIDKKKAEWYVEKKGLGKIKEYRRLSDDVLVPAAMVEDIRTSDPDAFGADYVVASVQLTFKPDFERFNDTHIRRDLDYFRLPKDNKCVVCGMPDKVIRCAVVPLMYRKYFPRTYVSHNSYDLLLVCPKCFVKVNFHHDRERERIAEEYQFPLATNQKVPLKLQKLDAGDVGPQKPLTAFEFTRETRHSVQQIVKFASALLRNLKATEQEVQQLPSEIPLSASTDAKENDAAEKRQKKIKSNPRASRKPAGGEGIAVRNAAWIPLDKLEAMESFVWTNTPKFSAFGMSGDDVSSVVGVDLALRKRLLEKIALSDVHAVVSVAVSEAFPQVAAVTVDTQTPSTSVSHDSAVGHEGLTATTIPQSLPQLRLDNHAAYVVSQVVQKYPGNVDAGVGEFILRWRRLFVEKLLPLHLPTGWRVDDGIILP
ncbi:3'-5' exonuclease, putative [Bodo saltans]|uniref:3'-5' exonuclease n=1 Tax=Bodo saltans TaxID=75058 RepID=A0A0S4JE73_BODSA|nr:3'-5' exonuclease, putative [Bodo saltans]|eukprot:CUG89878.1 3'-5' exonuclease, putative [Bodo saltans]